MITSWENECKVRAEPSLLGFCRTAAAFMKLIMAAHTSWHSSEAASGDHWCKSRAEPNSFGFCQAQPNDGRSQKQSKEKNGASRFLSLPMKKNNRLSAVSMYKARTETLCS